jgi:hypothetical protein
VTWVLDPVPRTGHCPGYAGLCNSERTRGNGVSDKAYCYALLWGTPRVLPHGRLRACGAPTRPEPRWPGVDASIYRYVIRVAPSGTALVKALTCKPSGSHAVYNGTSGRILKRGGTDSPPTRRTLKVRSRKVRSVENMRRPSSGIGKTGYTHVAGAHVQAAACSRMRSAGSHAVLWKRATRPMYDGNVLSSPPRRSPLQPLRGGSVLAVGVPVARRVGSHRRVATTSRALGICRDNK